MNPLAELNRASSVLRDCSCAYAVAPDRLRVQAFQALSEAAAAFTEARKAFRAWVNNLPPVSRPPSQEGR